MPMTISHSKYAMPMTISARVGKKVGNIFAQSSDAERTYSISLKIVLTSKKRVGTCLS